MKHDRSFFRTVHRTSLTCGVLFGIAFFALSCGPPPQGQYHVPESALAAAEKTMPPGRAQQHQAELPESATVQLQRHPYLKNAFKTQVRANRRSGLDDFYVTTRQNTQHSAMIGNCSFDVLKAFVAKGWAPIVMVQFEGRNPEVLPISDYSDHAEEVILQNPNTSAKRRLGYEAFQASWTQSSRKQCVLITPQQLTDIDIQNVLARYLPTTAFQGITVRSR